MHATPRNRIVTSSMWAAPFPVCHLQDAQKYVANASISRSGAICCGDLTSIESHCPGKKIDLFFSTLTLLQPLLG
jgi:hypothetical protein